MRTSESLSEFAPAFAKAQAEIEEASKDGKASVTPSSGRGGYQYRYMTLAACIEAARPALAKHGLSVLQAASTGVQTATIVTRVLHVSGQWMESELSLPVAKWDAQGIGSALTYARRYGYCALVGVVGDEDDDGEKAVRPASKPMKWEAPPPIVNPATGEEKPASLMNGTELPPEPTINPLDARRLWKVAREHGWTDTETAKLLKDTYRVDATTSLPKSKLEDALARLSEGTDSMEPV